MGSGGTYSSTVLTLALEWLASRPDRFTPAEIIPGTQWLGRWVGPIAVVDAIEKSSFIRTQDGLKSEMLKTSSPYCTFSLPIFAPTDY